MNTRTRQIIYLILSVLGVVLTWKNNLEWIGTIQASGPAVLVQFWQDAFATPIASSLAWDILIVAVMGMVFVIVESRRLGMRYWPVLYFVFANFIAAAFIFPLFMFFRERRIEAMGE